MIELVLDATSATPLGEQIAAGVRRQIADGRLRAGDPLPPARDLATATGVNLHTVLRGYHQLRDDGLIELRRGRGARVAADASAATAAFDGAIRLAAAAAIRLGLDPDDAADVLRQAMRS